MSSVIVGDRKLDPDTIKAIKEGTYTGPLVYNPYVGHPTNPNAWVEPPNMPILDSGERQEFPSGMVRDTQAGKGRFDLISPFALQELANIYEAGCQKYGDRNWEKGAPFGRFLDSAQRHLNKYRMRRTDEKHLIMAVWNLLCIVHFEALGRTDLDDRPEYSNAIHS